MKLIKAINTSAAIGIDSAGHEVVVLGKGIGFPKMPYELKDLSIIDRSFYDVDPQYIGMLARLERTILLASADIYEQAVIKLSCELNPNLPLTLADHLQFTIERLKKGIDLAAPLYFDVKYLYADEFELGLMAIDVLHSYTGTVLPEEEAVNIALHILNAEVRTGESSMIELILSVLEEIDEIIEKNLGISIDKDSYHYGRFTAHIRYLIQRLASDGLSEKGRNSLFRSVAKDYPDIYRCALEIKEHLKTTYGWTCEEEEILYLMLHIQRLTADES